MFLAVLSFASTWSFLSDVRWPGPWWSGLRSPANARTEVLLHTPLTGQMQLILLLGPSESIHLLQNCTATPRNLPRGFCDPVGVRSGSHAPCPGPPKARSARVRCWSSPYPLTAGPVQTCQGRALHDQSAKLRPWVALPSDPITNVLSACLAMDSRFLSRRRTALSRPHEVGEGGTPDSSWGEVHTASASQGRGKPAS